MKTKFNIERYKESVKIDPSFGDEKDRPELLELLSYGTLIESQFFYDQKQKFFSLMDQYLEHQISECEFMSRFRLLERECSKKTDKIQRNWDFLSSLFLVENIKTFGKLIIQVSDLCNPEDPEEKYSDHFYQEIKEIRSELKTHFE